MPELARGLGQGWQEFRRSAREVASDAEEDGATPVPQGLATAIESTGGLNGGAV
jgi:Sec-independent protein translocase protein TatA